MAEYQDNLWAPWRMEYIDALGKPGADGCFLCRHRDHPERDEEQLVLWRTPHSLVALNKFPYSSGHTLVAPLRHVAGLELLEPGELLDLVTTVRDAKLVLETALRAEGFNIGMNLGRCAGAGLPDHLHAHLVPRWSGDTNFMPVLGGVKVIPEALAATRRKILAAAAQRGLTTIAGA